MFRHPNYVKGPSNFNKKGTHKNAVPERTNSRTWNIQLLYENTYGNMSPNNLCLYNNFWQPSQGINKKKCNVFRDKVM